MTPADKKIYRLPTFRVIEEPEFFDPPRILVGMNVFIPARRPEPQTQEVPWGLIYLLLGVAFAVGRLVTLAMGF